MKELEKQEQEAINYVEKDLIAQHSDFQTQGIWQEVILNYLKNQALVFSGQAIIHLKNQAIQWAVDLSHWLLTNLEEYLVSIYQKSSPEEQKIFFQKIQEHFPNSLLLKNLRENQSKI